MRPEIGDVDTRRGGHVVLVGLMGAGKSTVGSLVAGRLGLAFVDLDERIAAAAGRPVAELIAEEGEPTFRDREAEALAHVLAGPPAVVATGGGVVERAANRRALACHRVVWLRGTTATLVARVGAGAGRPLLRDDPRAVLEQLGRRRTGWYEEVADVVVDTDELDPEAAADTTVAAVTGQR